MARVGALDYQRLTGGLEYVARFVAIALIVGISLAGPLGNWTGLDFQDTDHYWEAAMRLRNGEPLYLALPDGSASDYRYAPWFAWVWVPLTFLPREAVTAVWALVGLGAALAVTIHVGRQGWAGLAVAAFMGVQLLWSVRGTNVQALLVAGLYFGLFTRWGPVIVALAASLKIFPLAFALVFIQRRQWRRLGVTLALTALLVAPLLLYDLSDFGRLPTGGDTNLSLFGVLPLAWFLLAAGTAAVALWLAWRRSFLTALGAGVAALAATPRLFLYDTTILLGAAGPDVQPDQYASTSSNRSVSTPELLTE